MGVTVALGVGLAEAVVQVEGLGVALGSGASVMAYKRLSGVVVVM